MVSVSAVLFDLDGVLVDACDWHYEALNLALIDMGYSPIDRESHLSKFNGLPTRVKLEMMGVSELDSIQINKSKQKYTLELIKNKASIMPEKQELHEYLKLLGIKIGCVTNSIEETAKEMLIRTGQIDFIDLLVTNEQVKKNKPYPDCYNYAVDILGVDPSFCICVEDSPKGIQAAINSRVKNVWVVENSTEVTKQNYINFLESKLCKF